MEICKLMQDCHPLSSDKEWRGRPDWNSREQPHPTPSLTGKCYAVVESTTCIREIQAGATCAITVTYDPTHLTSPTGLAYETIRITLASCTGKGHELIQNYTVVVPRKLDD